MVFKIMFEIIEKDPVVKYDQYIIVSLNSMSVIKLYKKVIKYIYAKAQIINKIGKYFSRNQYRIINNTRINIATAIIDEMTIRDKQKYSKQRICKLAEEESENTQNQKLPIILQQKTNSLRSIDEKQHKDIFQVEKDRQTTINNINDNNIGLTDQQKDQIQIHNYKQKSQFQKYQKIRQFHFLQNIQKPQFLELETTMSPSKNLLSEPSSQKTNVLSMDTSKTEANNQLQDKKIQNFQDSFTNQIQNTQQNKIINKKQSQLLNYLQNKTLLKKIQQILFKIKICGKQKYLISKGLQPNTKISSKKNIDSVDLKILSSIN
ncbi:hypothetical protein ABPG73_014537 [Tetrahymena malaccensis]